MRQLLYATTNEYKLLAANVALSSFDINLKGLEPGVPDISEIQGSQEEVALDKAQKYYELLKQPLIVMDFGFFINGLKGFPGVYTKHAIETIGVEGLIALAHNLEDRTAYTERTIVYTDGGLSKIFSYRCPGSIILEKRGKNGRDYDHIFYVDKVSKTLAEMTEEEKAALSGGAWRELGAWIQKGSHGRK